MSWRLTTLDGTARECTSRAVPTREEAIAWARGLADDGARVVRVTGPDDVTIEGDELASILSLAPRDARGDAAA